MQLNKSLEELDLYFWRKWRDSNAASKKITSLSFNEWGYLDFIGEHGSIKLTQLASGLGVSKASASTMVAKLEKRGFILRRLDEKDARVFHLTLSSAGKKIWHEEVSLYQQTANMLSNKMNADDYQILERALTQVCRILQSVAAASITTEFITTESTTTENF